MEVIEEKKLKELLNEDFRVWFELEEKLIKLHKFTNFSDLGTQKFKIKLRSFIVQSAASFSNSKALFPSAFTLSFLEYIKNEAIISFNKIENYSTVDKSVITKEIIRGFNLFMDSNYFDFTLDLSNSVNTDPSVEHRLKRFSHTRLSDILKSSKTLKDFLIKFKNNQNIIEGFLNITFETALEEKYKKLLKEDYNLFFQLEEKLIVLNNAIHFSDFGMQKFKYTLRYFLLITTANYNFSGQLCPGEFTLSFLDFAKTKTRIHLDKIKDFLKTKIKLLNKEIYLGLYVFVESNPYSLVSKRKRTRVFFKNLYYYYLKTGTIPTWANQEKIEKYDIINFISILVKKKEASFLIELFNQELVRDKLIKILENESDELYISLLELLNRTTISIKSKTIFKEIRNSSKVQVLSSFLIFEQIICNKLWLLKSPTFFKEALILILKDFEIEENSELNRSIDLFFNNKIKTPEIHDLENILRYLVDSKGLSIFPLVQQKEILNNLNKFLLKNPQRTLDYLIELKDEFPLTKELRLVFSDQLVLEAIYFFILKEENSVELPKFFLKQIKRIKSDNELFYRSINEIITFFVLGNKDVSLIIPHLLLAVKSFSEKHYVEIKEIINKKTGSGESQKLEEYFFNDKQVSIKEEFNALNYFIEFGSSQIKNFHFTKKDYKKIINISNRLILKKYIKNWSKNEEKIERFISLIYHEKDGFKTLDFIHPELKLLINDLPELINSLELKTTKTYTLPSSKTGLIKLTLKTWSNNTSSFNNPHQISADIVRDYLIKNKVNIDYILSNLDAFDLKNKRELILRELIIGLKKIKPQKNQFQTKVLDTEVLKREEMQKGILINNAGLVIAWPFLNTLFLKLGLIENNKLKNNESVQKAIIATEYLIRGKSNIREDKLVLNKILCGVAIESFVDEGLELDEVETGICDMALETIIKQWGKVKTVDVLRSYYLNRKGVLKLDENGGYSLFIEKQTRDILLKFLPWNISIIKSSLMKEKLIINWKY